MPQTCRRLAPDRRDTETPLIPAVLCGLGGHLVQCHSRVDLRLPTLVVCRMRMGHLSHLRDLTAKPLTVALTQLSEII